MLGLLQPDHHVASVCELTPAQLAEWGIDALLLDVDCTLKCYREEDVRPEVREWLGQLIAAGTGVCLVSNGLDGRIRRFAERFELCHVARAMKPFPFGCRRAVRRMHFDPRRTAMVGDQIFADVMAGRLAGLKTILVDPISPEQEPWYTRMKRPLERRLLRTRSSATSPCPPDTAR